MGREEWGVETDVLLGTLQRGTLLHDIKPHSCCAPGRICLDEVRRQPVCCSCFSDLCPGDSDEICDLRKQTFGKSLKTWVLHKRKWLVLLSEQSSAENFPSLAASASIV